MLIKDAIFICSVVSHLKAPKNSIPEYAFFGRSNVGKSSLINMLTGKAKLAKISGTPGKTQTINFFLINDSWHLVDLPGTGYAKTSKSIRNKWGKMIRDYIRSRKTLVNTFYLVDSRHAPLDNDIDFINWFGENGIPFSIVFTKADKLRAHELKKNTQIYMDFLHQYWETLPRVFITSASMKLGRKEILDYIGENNTVIREP